MNIKELSLGFLSILILLTGCSSTPEQVVSRCANGTTDVDGICVDQEWANFISCVNSQSLELGSEIKNTFSASIAYKGSGIEGSKEAINNISKKYSASDDVKKIVINKCGEMAGMLNGNKNIPEKIRTSKVLKDPIDPIQTSFVDDYVFDLYSCNNIGRNVKCNFTISKENGGEAYFHRQSHKGTSLIYYGNGESKAAYKLMIGKAGGTKDRFGVRLPPGVPIKGNIEFRGVNTDSIQLLELGVGWSVLHNPKYARFRDIAVTGG